MRRSESWLRGAQRGGDPKIDPGAHTLLLLPSLLAQMKSPPDFRWRPAAGAGDTDGLAGAFDHAAPSRELNFCFFPFRSLAEGHDEDICAEDEEAAPFISDAEQASQLRVRFSRMVTLSASITTKLTAFYYFHLSSLDPPGSYLRSLHLQAAKVAALLAVFIVMCFPFHRVRCVRARPAHRPPGGSGDASSPAFCGAAPHSKVAGKEASLMHQECALLCPLQLRMKLVAAFIYLLYFSLAFVYAGARRRCRRLFPVELRRAAVPPSSTASIHPHHACCCCASCPAALAAASRPDVMCEGTPAAASRVLCTRKYAYAVELMVKILLPTVMQARGSGTLCSEHRGSCRSLSCSRLEPSPLLRLTPPPASSSAVHGFSAADPRRNQHDHVCLRVRPRLLYPRLGRPEGRPGHGHSHVRGHAAGSDARAGPAVHVRRRRHLFVPGALEYEESPAVI